MVITGSKRHGSLSRELERAACRPGTDEPEEVEQAGAPETETCDVFPWRGGGRYIGRLLPAGGGGGALLFRAVSRGMVNFFDFAGAACVWRTRLSGLNESVSHAPSGESVNAAYASRLTGVFGEGLGAGTCVLVVFLGSCTAQ